VYWLILTLLKTEKFLSTDFQPEIDAILASGCKYKNDLLCSPNNPTGNSFSDESGYFTSKF
jgi:histidinol-phosphate aminotransferase